MAARLSVATGAPLAPGGKAPPAPSHDQPRPARHLAADELGLRIALWSTTVAAPSPLGDNARAQTCCTASTS